MVQVAPQHGSIIPEHLVRFIFSKLKTLDCGIYMLARKDTDLCRLVDLNQTLRDLTHSMVLYRDFREIATSLMEIVSRHLPVDSLSFYSRMDSGVVIHLAPELMYHGVIVDPPVNVKRLLGSSKTREKPLRVELCDEEGSRAWLLPLYPGGCASKARFILKMSADTTLH